MTAACRVFFGTATASGTTGATNRWLIESTGHFMPVDDNTYNIGSGGNRCGTIFAATGAINTSDAREKTEVRGLSAAELGAAKELAAEVGVFSWLTSLEAKGGDARPHTGMTLQRAIEIMGRHGLDAFRYG